MVELAFDALTQSAVVVVSESGPVGAGDPTHLRFYGLDYRNET